MKLRKAMEKAKMMRGESAGDFRRPVVETRSPDTEWQSPEYSKSIHRDVDAGLLRDKRCIAVDPDAPVLDWYKVLRTKILEFCRPKGWNTIMITSPGPREGKTLTAVNLSLTFAKAYNQTVLLVDCDLKRQNIHRVFGLQSTAGLVDFLVDSRPLKDFMIWPGIEQLTLISGGRPIQNSAELLSSNRMKNLVEEMKVRYKDRYIIFDTPPLLMGADSIALAPLVDGILLVVREGRTAMRDVKAALEALPAEKIIGHVVNCQKNGLRKGYYHHYPG